MNEFFSCPSYFYGVIILSIIFGIIGFVIPDSIKPIYGIFVGLSMLSWLLWFIYKLLFAGEICKRPAFPDHSPGNPFNWNDENGIMPKDNKEE